MDADADCVSGLSYALSCTVNEVKGALVPKLDSILKQSHENASFWELIPYPTLFVALEGTSIKVGACHRFALFSCQPPQAYSDLFAADRLTEIQMLQVMWASHVVTLPCEVKLGASLTGKDSASDVQSFPRTI